MEASLTQPLHAISLAEPIKRRGFSQGDEEMCDKVIDLTEDCSAPAPVKKPRLQDKRVLQDIQKSIEPKTVTDLAVNGKKIDELRGWLREYERLKKTRPNAMLNLTGPCGSGKLTAVKVLAHELHYEIFEYTSQIDKDYKAYNSDTGLVHLTKFVLDSSRFGSIFIEAPKKKLLIVKDFPNVLLESPQLFNDVLE